MANLSIKLSEDKIQKLKDTFKDYIKESPNEYIDTFISKENVTISIYKSGKVLFQGEDALFYGESYIDTKFIRHAGSDEVGTGDFFGPVVVCASIVEKEDEKLLNSLNIKDSKEIDDEKILKIGPTLKDKIKNTVLILDNEKYNEVHKSNNLNSIKAKLHNKAYLNLISKGYELPKLCYIDDFCGEDKYFDYLKDQKEVYKDVILETKAENKYLAVAVSSCIARYVFLKKMEELNDKYHMFFHKGASSDVDIDANTFVKKYGRDELNKVCKIHFKNYNNINY